MFWRDRPFSPANRLKKCGFFGKSGNRYFKIDRTCASGSISTFAKKQFLYSASVPARECWIDRE
ncbi:hypothetical protein, partial [Microcoleus sp. herbarium12]|uniref:hypothetical protein n=1 Tax=Microcoleus sp. herbarium12 TaxID=3055437 RepID=UPI002FD76A46